MMLVHTTPRHKFGRLARVLAMATLAAVGACASGAFGPGDMDDGGPTLPEHGDDDPGQNGDDDAEDDPSGTEEEEDDTGTTGDPDDGDPDDPSGDDPSQEQSDGDEGDGDEGDDDDDDDDGDDDDGDDDDDSGDDDTGDSSGDDDDDNDDAEPIRQIAAGRAHTCALLGGGRVRCWGDASDGALGYGNEEDLGDDEEPSSAGDVDLGEPALSLAAGGWHTCALLEEGNVRCWGQGQLGQLGYANKENVGDDETPGSVGYVDIGGRVVGLTAGMMHTCALLDDGAVRCWGIGFFGQLGYGNRSTIGDDETPASAGDVAVGGPVREITAGQGHTCAALESGELHCWGTSNDGALGYPGESTVGVSNTPADAGAVDVGGVAVAVAAGASHTCALLSTGDALCWGSGGAHLGYKLEGDIGDDETPASAGTVDVGESVAEIGAGDEVSCARLDGGGVRCWGRGAVVGYGDGEAVGDDEFPREAGDLDMGAAIESLAVGDAHACGRTGSATVRCWGDSGNGRLGYGNTVTIGDDEVPAAAGDVPLF